MNLRTYIGSMSAMNALTWAVFAYILFAINPKTTNWVGFGLFYASLFVSLVGAASIAGFLIRFKIMKRNFLWESAKEAFRQSFLFAALAVASLILLSYDMFTWLNIILLVAALSLIEYFLLTLTKYEK